ncbi:craniofacial development protein 2-like [Centruroides vittatus]|uniref:craniofacial development protein 2-like n=1 Tax=Centruroides vittatus TaxID=120091 RepID=UPI00350FE038
MIAFVAIHYCWGHTQQAGSGHPRQSTRTDDDHDHLEWVLLPPCGQKYKGSGVSTSSMDSTPLKYTDQTRNASNVATGSKSNNPGAYQRGKMANVMHEMKRLKISILGISETRWAGKGYITTDKEIRFVYLGGMKHQQGVGVMLEKMAKLVDGYWQVSDRTIALRIDAKPRDLFLIQTYMSTNDHSDEETEEVYKHINKCLQVKRREM